MRLGIKKMQYFDVIALISIEKRVMSLKKWRFATKYAFFELERALWFIELFHGGKKDFRTGRGVRGVPRLRACQAGTSMVGR